VKQPGALQKRAGHKTQKAGIPNVLQEQGRGERGSASTLRGEKEWQGTSTSSIAASENRVQVKALHRPIHGKMLCATCCIISIHVLHENWAQPGELRCEVQR
jgi:hypothetical protein